MKKYLTSIVLLAFILSSSGCQFQQRSIATDPFPDMNDRMLSPAPIFIIGAGVLAVIGIAAVVNAKESKKNKHLFQEIGCHVPYLMHEEAPAAARFLGDVECREYSQTEVKNKLRIKAGQMGGNLLVIDAISESHTEDETLSYSGSGRVYSVKDSPKDIRKVSVKND